MVWIELLILLFWRFQTWIWEAYSWGNSTEVWCSKADFWYRRIVCAEDNHGKVTSIWSFLNEHSEFLQSWEKTVYLMSFWCLCYEQSGFEGFIRDQYTALPETRERMLATEVTALWRQVFPISLIIWSRRIAGICRWMINVLDRPLRSIWLQLSNSMLTFWASSQAYFWDNTVYAGIPMNLHLASPRTHYTLQRDIWMWKNLWPTLSLVLLRKAYTVHLFKGLFFKWQRLYSTGPSLFNHIQTHYWHTRRHE